MKISKIGEFGLIERIKKSLKNPDIGHDCAPVTLGGKTYLATCDILLEDRHFLRSYDPVKVGYKAIAVNASDIVASGGKPDWSLISLMVPDIDHTYVDGLYKGIKKACRDFDCHVIGGNVSKSEKIGVDVFMIGKARKFVGRKTAKVGDRVFVTGTLGDSRAGLELLLKNKASYEPFEKKLIERHLKPEVNLKVADYLARNATSSMDVSDGLSSDLYQLFDEKKVMVAIDPNKIPFSREFLAFCKKYRYDHINYAVKGGEDYKILFTQSKKASPFFEIGEVKKGRGVYLSEKIIVKQSFDHFTP